MTDTYLGVTALGVIRLQLAAVYEPGLRDGHQSRWLFRPTMGVQFNSPF
ncbi:MAG: hypothetical protein ACJAYU_001426 [Bradymonadia bacterium]